MDIRKISTSAIGLSLFRFDPNRMYGGVDFNTHATLEVFIRRLKVFGFVCDQDNARGACDLTDENGDIVDTVFLNSAGVSHCRKKLNLRVQH